MNYLIILALVMIYEVGRVTLGLAVHPYRTMREVVRDRWEWPLMWVVSLMSANSGRCWATVSLSSNCPRSISIMTATDTMGLVME